MRLIVFLSLKSRIGQGIKVMKNKKLTNSLCPLWLWHLVMVLFINIITVGLIAKALYLWWKCSGMLLIRNDCRWERPSFVNEVVQWELSVFKQKQFGQAAILRVWEKRGRGGWFCTGGTLIFHSHTLSLILISSLSRWLLDKNNRKQGWREEESCNSL